MNRSHPNISPEETQKFPLSTLLIAVVILTAAAAILVFKVPIGTVLYYGLLGLMLSGGHRFMHAGHDHGGSPDPQSHLHDQNSWKSTSITGQDQIDGPSTSNRSRTDAAGKPDPQDHSHSGHSGCC